MSDYRGVYLFQAQTLKNIYILEVFDLPERACLHMILSLITCGTIHTLFKYESLKMSVCIRIIIVYWFIELFGYNFGSCMMSSEL